MRVLLLGGLLVAAGGCEGAHALDGTWVLELNPSCAAGLTFDIAEGAYAHQLSCAAGADSANDEIEGGTLKVRFDRLTLEPRRTSCPLHEPVSAAAINYEVSGNQVSLFFPGHTQVYFRSPAGMPLAAVVEYGCHVMTGFVPHTVQNL